MVYFSYFGKDYSAPDPNTCPHCHNTITPKPLNNYSASSSPYNTELISLWNCPNNDCKKVLIAAYSLKSQSNEAGSKFSFDGFLNGYPKGPEWPTPILELRTTELGENSEFLPSKFIKIYLQSLEAEHKGLDEIAGMGYRKAIEFLVKDWAISKHPEDVDKIKNDLWLSQVIDKYFEGPIKGILARATWLGNDQSHYQRLFDDFNLDTLRELIDLILSDLDREYKMNHYLTTIEKRK